MTAPSQAPLSAGTLVYLWGDQVVPAPGRLSRKVTLPSGAVVGAADLAPQVFAVSFWHLATQGVIALQPAKRRSMLLLKSADVAVSVLADPGPRDGYEEAILRVLGRSGGTAYGVVRKWFGSDVSNPSKVALRPALDEIPRHGLGHQQEEGRGIAGIFKSAPELAFDTEAIRGTWADFHRLHEGWRSYRDHDPLGRVLVESCRKAISSRQESSD